MSHGQSESRGELFDKLQKKVDFHNRVLIHMKVIIPSIILYLVWQYFWFSYGYKMITPDETGYFSWAEEWASGEYQVFRLYGDRTVFIFIVSIIFRVFGASLTLGRWIVHLFGIGLMIITYFLAMEVYDRRVGILSMLILTFSGFFQFLSYFGLTDIPSTFFFACTFYFFLKALKYNNRWYSAIAGIFFLLGPLTKISYMVIFPIVAIMWLKRVIKKELTLKRAFEIAGSSLIFPIVAVIGLLALFPGMFTAAFGKGVLLFAQEIITMDFLRERINNLIQGSGEGGLLGIIGAKNAHPTSISHLVKILLLPGKYEGPWEQLYFQYYLVERWIWVFIFVLSLLFRRTRKFDLMSWIVVYIFVWLILTPAAGRIHVAEISDRYLYPIVPVLYIQFARLAILAVDGIQSLQGKTVLDYFTGMYENKKMAVLFVLPMMPILWLIKSYLSISIFILFFFVIWLLIGFIYSRGKVRLTVFVTSITVLLIIIANPLVQIRITDTFVPTSAYRAPSLMFPPDMLEHEKIGSFEEGIWFWASYHHVPPNRFTTKFFNEDIKHAPGQFGGLYLWFSNYTLTDSITMFVRWTTDFSSDREFKGYFEGSGIKFTSLWPVGFEETEQITLETDNYLKFSGEVEKNDHDGFNVVLEFLPNQQYYWIDWDLFNERDPEHIFLGDIPLAEIAEQGNTIMPPHRIVFSTHSLHLRWRGGSTLLNHPVLFNITNQGLILQAITHKNFPRSEKDQSYLYQNWDEEKNFLPVQSYTISSSFEDSLKEVDLYLSYYSWKKTRFVEFNADIHEKLTDPAYLHLGTGKRDVPLIIDIYSTDDVYQWSISTGVREFFNSIRTSHIISYFGLIMISWIILLIPLIWLKRSIMPLNKTKSRKKKEPNLFLNFLVYKFSEKIEQNRLPLLFGWIFLGSLSLSLISMYLQIVPFWWGLEGKLKFGSIFLQEASWFLFWRVFEELILIGSICVGILFTIKFLTHIIRYKLNRSLIINLKKLKLTQTYLSGQSTPKPQKNASYRPRLTKQKKTQIKNTATSMVILFFVALTFTVVITNDVQYMDQLTIPTRYFHESLEKAYRFLEAFAEPDTGVLAYQKNFANWYTHNKFRLSTLDSDWSESHIWETISNREIEYVVISEWDDYSPFKKFEKHPEKYEIIWSFRGTVGWLTVIYETNIS